MSCFGSALNFSVSPLVETVHVGQSRACTITVEELLVVDSFPRKFDVLKTNIYLGNEGKYARGKGATIRPIVPRHGLIVSFRG